MGEPRELAASPRPPPFPCPSPRRYWGFHTRDAVGPDATPSPNWPSHDPPLLTPEAVAGIHNYGGTFLGSDRGGHDVDVILRFLEGRGVNQIFVIGGDGTHRGADAIFRASAERGLAIAVAAIPKTIDNDSAGGGDTRGELSGRSVAC